MTTQKPIRHCERSEAIHLPSFRLKRVLDCFVVTLLAMTIFISTAHADDTRKLDLAKQMHEFRPVAEQVNKAITQFAQSQAPEQREAFITAMQNALDIEMLGEKSVQAYVDTFTLPELEAMVEYYAKPEARSASDKFNDYAAIIYPEIIKMLDSAAMKARVGGN